MAAVKYAAATLLRAAREPKVAAAVAATPAAAATTATLSIHKMQRAATKSESAGPTAEPSVKRMIARRGLATPTELATVLGGTGPLAISRKKSDTVPTPEHLVRSIFSCGQRGVVCQSHENSAHTYDLLNKCAFGTIAQPVPLLLLQAKQSRIASADCNAGVTSNTSSTQQNTSHFAVNDQQVLVSSTSTIPGYVIVSYKGFVQGCSVQARDMLLMAKVFLLVQLGGELQDMASLIQRAKAEAVEQVRREAAAIGANGVVGVRLVSSGTHQRTAVEFSAYGTAVLIKKET